VNGLSAKPISNLTQFAATLGWSDLRTFQHSIDEKAVSPQPFLVTWYESGHSERDRSDFFLQINEAPSGQVVTYAGAVYAIRYRIFTGWHAFTLFDETDQLTAEAERVDRWLHRRWFETISMRRQFRNDHPECAGYSWSRIRKEGPPYALPESD
jgi:hypothetical protein